MPRLRSKASAIIIDLIVSQSSASRTPGQPAIQRFKRLIPEAQSRDRQVPPHPGPLPKGRGGRPKPPQRRSLSQPYPLADMATLEWQSRQGEIAGEGRGEGVSRASKVKAVGITQYSSIRLTGGRGMLKHRNRPSIGKGFGRKPEYEGFA
jgi:hypothetical protein